LDRDLKDIHSQSNTFSYQLIEVRYVICEAVYFVV